MKKIVFTLVMLLASVSWVSAQVQRVNFECNIHTVNKEEGQWRKLWRLDDKDGGYVLIHKSAHPDEQVGKKGLLIIRDCFNMDEDEPKYWAFDLECPACAYKGVESEIKMVTNLVAECPTCRAEWQNVIHGSAGQTNRMGKYWLKAYRATLVGDIVRVRNY